MTASSQFTRAFRRAGKRVLNSMRDRLPRLDPRFCYKWEIAWWRNQDWSEPYRRYLQRDGRGGARILDRRFTLLQFASSVRHLAGSTAECGVAGGTGSALICRALSGTYAEGARHLAFDSFEGLPPPKPADYMTNGRCRWYEGKLKTDHAAVKAFLAEFAFCQTVKGWIPACFAPFADREFRFVHIDVDLYQPTWDSLEFFYPRMHPGGVFVFDDHGFIDCPGARAAAESFFADKPESLVELATGQAFSYKVMTRVEGGPGR